jgi:hypothetical protein
MAIRFDEKSWSLANRQCIGRLSQRIGECQASWMEPIHEL